MNEEDELLLEQINVLADRAEVNKPGLADIKALAITLAQHFSHRTPEEIEEKCKDVWRDRGLFWTG